MENWQKQRYSVKNDHETLTTTPESHCFHPAHATGISCLYYYNNFLTSLPASLLLQSLLWSLFSTQQPEWSFQMSHYIAPLAKTLQWLHIPLRIKVKRPALACKALNDLLPWLCLTSCSSVLLPILWTFQTRPCLRGLAFAHLLALSGDICLTSSFMWNLYSVVTLSGAPCIKSNSVPLYATFPIFIFLLSTCHHLTCCVCLLIAFLLQPECKLHEGTGVFYAPRKVPGIE